MKQCFNCNNFLSKDNFRPQKHTKDKLNTWCKECEKTIVEKECRDCHEIKPINQFRKERRSYDGHYTACKQCEKIERDEKLGKNIIPNNIFKRFRL